MHTVCSTGRGFAIGLTAGDLAQFAARWPGGIGRQSAPAQWRGAALVLDFDRATGDLEGINGDDGLDELAVAAMAEDALAFAATVYEIDPATVTARGVELAA